MKIKIFFLIWLLSVATLSAGSIKVRGTAELFRPADLSSLSIGITTEGKTAEKALAANREQMIALIAAIKALEHEGMVVQTGQFTISPSFDSPSSTITHFQVNNTLTISTPVLGHIGKLLDAATAAGANQINSLSFSLRNPRQYRAEAIQAATAQAIEDAKTVAKAADVELKKVKGIQLLDGDAFPAPKVAMLFARSTPIEPRDVEISATVEVEFEIN